MVDRPPRDRVVAGRSHNTLYFIVGALVVAVLLVWLFAWGGDAPETAGSGDTNVTIQQPAPGSGAGEPAGGPPAAADATPPASDPTPPADVAPPADTAPPAGDATPPAGGAPTTPQ
ncbi:hypothetical protein ACUN0C_01990 [Faunimonas sp. B44]|uniref:hypothetical protein n=1 Tax=Faunimonas sp. B44 TaxID=3461493 RepID=UPI00404436E4